MKSSMFTGWIFMVLEAGGWRLEATYASCFHLASLPSHGVCSMTRQTPMVTIGGDVQILHPLLPSYLMCDCGVFSSCSHSLTFISQYWQLWTFYAACTFILLIAIAQVETDVSTVQYSTVQ